MLVWVITDHHGVFVGVYSTPEEAMQMAELKEKTGDYPVDSLYVDSHLI